MKKFIVSFAALGVLGSVVGISYSVFQLSDKIQYPLDWHSGRLPYCSEWLNEVGFKDLSSKGSDSFVDFSCRDALDLPRKDYRLVSSSGMRIRYSRFLLEGEDQAATEDRPIWLHIHGLNGNFLHGARYYGVASRLGFRLFTVDLSNHGQSEDNGKGAGYGCREHHDVATVFNHLTRRYPRAPVFVSASSIGAAALMLAAKSIMVNDRRNQLVAVQLESPFLNVQRSIQYSPLAKGVPRSFVHAGVILAALRSGVPFNSCYPSQQVSNLKIPILVHHGMQDQVVSEQVAKTVFAKLDPVNQNKLKIYKKGGHASVWNGQPEQFEQDIREIWSIGLSHIATKPSENQAL